MKKPIAATVCSVVGTILLALVIVVCILLTVPRIAGLSDLHSDQWKYGAGNSDRQPCICKKVRLRPESKKGDVIAFYGSLENGSIITHRVVSNNSVSGEFVTKGDANAKEDMEPVSYENFLGKSHFECADAWRNTGGGCYCSGKKFAAGSMILLALVLHVIAGKLKGSSKEQ